MTLEELEKAVKNSYYAPEMDEHEIQQDIRLPLFRLPLSTSYITHKHKLPRFQL